MGGSTGLLYLLMVVAVFWFLLVRPQQKQAKQRAEMLTALKAGDRVITIGGICGVITQITDTKIFIEVSDGVVLEMLRNSISSLDNEADLKDPFADEEEEEEDDDSDIYYDEDEDDDIIDLEKDKDNK